MAPGPGGTSHDTAWRIVTAPQVWWGATDLPEGSLRVWHIGAVSLFVQRLQHEWRTAWAYPPNGAIGGPPAAPPEDIMTLDTVTRYGVSDASSVLTLNPILADRPIVTRPEKPFIVPSGETVEVFVALPVWVRLEIGDPPRLLQEVPSAALRETWFGPSTREGQLSYASRIPCHLRWEDLPLAPHRSTTVVRVINDAPTPLALDRMEIPAPFLGVFESQSGHLWTPDVELRREEDGHAAAFDTNDAPPARARGARRLAPPRSVPTKRMVIQAFGSLFR